MNKSEFKSGDFFIDPTDDSLMMLISYDGIRYYSFYQFPRDGSWHLRTILDTVSYGHWMNQLIKI